MKGKQRRAWAGRPVASCPGDDLQIGTGKLPVIHVDLSLRCDPLSPLDSETAGTEGWAVGQAESRFFAWGIAEKCDGG